MRKRNYIFIICVLLCGQLRSLVAMEQNALPSYQQLYALAEVFNNDGKKNALLGRSACEQRKKYITKKIGIDVLNPDICWSKKENRITSVSPFGCYWNKYKSACVAVLLYENSENPHKDLVFKRYQLGENGKIDQWKAQWHNFNEALLDGIPPCFDSHDNFCLYNFSPSVIEYCISSEGVKSAISCNLCFKKNDEWCYESFADIKEEVLLEAIVKTECFEMNTFDYGTLLLYPIHLITFPDVYISYIEKQPILFHSWLRSLNISPAARRAMKRAIFAQAVSGKLKKWIQAGYPKRRASRLPAVICE